MKRHLAIWLAALVLAPLSAPAQDLSFNGTRPALIVDVRSAQEYASGHIDGAVNIPYDEIGQRVPSLKGIGKDSAILVYCRSGRRSAIARATLEQQGFKHILDGGAIDALAPKLKPCTPQTC